MSAPRSSEQSLEPIEPTSRSLGCSSDDGLSWSAYPRITAGGADVAPVLSRARFGSQLLGQDGPCYFRCRGTADTGFGCMESEKSKVLVLAGDGTELVADVWNHNCSATLLLLPAGAETRQVWLPVVEHLPEAVRSSWRIVAADHRGHGGSGRSPTYDFDQLNRDFATWLAELAARPLVVAGGSIGGALGMIAAGEGAMMDGLALLDVPVAPVLERVMLERSRIRSAASSGSASVSTIDPRFIASGIIEDVFRDVDRWSRAARRIKIPTLLIAGRAGVIGPEQLQQFNEHIPHGEVECLQTGHLVARDDPQGVAKSLGDFLLSHWPGNWRCRLEC